MFTGWKKPFKIERPLQTEERSAGLPVGRQPRVVPHSYSGLIKLNSSCADLIDRRFRLRGMVNTTVVLFGALFIPALSLFLASAVTVRLVGDGEIAPAIFFVVAVACMGFLGPWLFWRTHLSYDMLTYTHYPVRFNRKTRKVHVFRYIGPGGVLTVPFDDVFWHVGRGLQHKFLCDVRGHVMEGNTVKDTFAVGHYFDDSQIDRIYSMWEFIRRYMDEGPEAVAEHPLDRTIDLSMTPSWTNCYLWAAASLGQGVRTLRFVLFPILYPIYGLLTLGRWLTLNSCRTPEWPPEIEAECQTDPDDPHRWEEPSYLWEFANREGVAERELERERQRTHS